MTVNVSEILAVAARRDPQGTALVERREERRAVTWSELDAAATAVSRGLSARGLRAGHRVGLVMANRIDLVIAYFAVLRGGMVAVPINPRSTPREVERMLADSGARVVLADGTAVDAVRAAAGAIDHLTVVVDGPAPEGAEVAFADFLDAAVQAEPAAPADPESLAVILYTSGTSGRPRGVMLSHRALLANIEQVATLDVVGADDVCLGLLPMFHIYGLNCVLGQAVHQGSPLVLVDGFDPDGLLDLIGSEGITYLPVAPPVVAAWSGRPDLREKLASVRVVVSGASALDPDLARDFRESSGHVIEQGYGLTEASPVIAVTIGATRGPDGEPKAHSVGALLPGIDIRVVETVDGREAAPGDPAEIWVRGANLLTGYWPDGADGPDADGWYPTGDVGLLDADGDLTLVDRLRELVIVSGFNVYPSEVEDVIAEAPGVAQVAVVGLPHEETGEQVIAFVVPLAGTDQDEVRAAVEAACRTRLARFKQPTTIEVVEGLPYSATGKVAKGRLRALARGTALGLR
ncbi:class I adenylate-forming enzyme family protein [Aeromicrobium sp. Leaf350]|uniref:class I adenylate-forming enzyme family protein n=1 Tax=Aeromicrobium sp. Leaf350 TaxID=2876565 RepID=UPI001E516793|nr:class I adenylate-forming enzyme family protein [Aeromicrobium sp. Leaf350]